MSVAILTSRLNELAPTIAEICRVTGIAGLSLGVMHHGKVIHQANFGYRDINAQLPPNENTTYVIGSLTKSFVAAMAGILVEQGNLTWGTMLRDVVPEYHRNHSDPTVNITIVDLLSHRSGLAGLDGLWLLSGGSVALTHKDVIAVLSTAPAPEPFRSGFLYNNLAYEAVAQVIEKRSGSKFEEFLQDQLLRPLGMSHTYYTTPPINMGNAAKGYACLLNMSHVEIPLPLEGHDIAMGAAGGIRSSVKDLLTWGKALIDAAHMQFTEDSVDHDDHSYYPQGNPLKQLPEVWTGKIKLASKSYREHSYGMGWARAQLPQELGVTGTDYVKVGGGSGCPASHILLYHQGSIPGFYSFNAILPEESSAVVVLGNSLSLADPTKLIGALLLETLIHTHTTVNISAFIETAQIFADQGRKLASSVFQSLQQRKNIIFPVKPLNAYTGRYFHPVTDYYIDVAVENNTLRVAFMGKEADTYYFEPYQPDSFFTQMSHDEIMSKGQVIWDPDYYVLRFGCLDTMEASEGTRCLRWKYDSYLPGDGDIFRTKLTPNTRINHSQSFIQSLIHSCCGVVENVTSLVWNRFTQTLWC